MHCVYSGFMRVVALVLALSLTCPAGPAVADDDGTEVPRQAGGQAKDLAGRAKARANQLRSFAFNWLGTPYLWGGTTRSGIDCSGFLREMFRTVYNVELPRTTRDQINLGREVRIDFRDLGKNFEPGDLFFYVDSTGTPNHVVTYIGQGQFTHSAGGRGVVVDGWKALWGRRIVGRRVLVPAREGGTVDEGPIPALAPFRPQEVPCPPSIRARPDDVRRYRVEPLGTALGTRELCEWRALKDALEAKPGPASADNARRIAQQIEWLDSLEALADTLRSRP